MGSVVTGSMGAGPASGKQTGFGSEDINRLGYNKEGQFAQPYDPYTKAQSVPSAYVKESQPKAQKKEQKESSSESENSSVDSDDSDEKAKKKRRA